MIFLVKRGCVSVLTQPLLSEFYWWFLGNYILGVIS